MAVKLVYTPEQGLFQIEDPDGGAFLSGSVQLERISYRNITVVDDYTMGTESVVFANCVLNDVILTLPPARKNKGHVFHMKKVDSTGNFLIIACTAGQTVDGQAALMINTQYTTLTATSDGVNWFIL